MTITILSKLFSFSISCGTAPAVGNCDGDASTRPRHSFSSRLMDENIAFAESVITKWDSDRSNHAKLNSLFSEGRAEASRFLRAVADLRRAMLFFSSPDCSDPSSTRSDSLIRAQTLMQSAMRRLEHEFHRILSANRQRMDPESLSSSSSSEEDDIHLSSSDAIGDLCSIAETMMANGYGMECVRIYKLLRKSILEEALFRLGFDLRLPNSNIHKIDWPVLDLRIRSWLAAARISFSVLFAAERRLSNNVFDSSDSFDLDLDLAESCFADIANDAALQLLSFPESMAKTKPSPDKLFRVMELHQTIADLYPQIESTFSYESTESVKTKALEALKSLADTARDSLTDFELAVQKDSLRIFVPGGGIHPFTRNSMNYLACLADNVPALAAVYAGVPFRPPGPLPEMLEPCPSTIAPASVSERIAWLLLVVLCKLDHKAEIYKEVSLSYLFLANNVQYVVNQVKGSGLRMILGVRWAERHEETAMRYLERYLRLVWGKAAAAAEAAASAPAPGEDEILAFNSAFEAAAAALEGSVVPDEKMRDEIKVKMKELIVPAYQEFYERIVAACDGGVAEPAVIRYTPEGLRDRIEQMFDEPNGSESARSV